jgi:tRNA(Arg) A34 adenosine deaminase TadA
MTAALTSVFLLTPRYSLVSGAARTRSTAYPSDGPLVDTFDISPGVRPGSGFVRSAEEAAARAVALAEEAGKQGTFAVGGLLVDNSGRIVAEATNAVIRDSRLSDPSAHVERQLIDWVFRERSRGRPLTPRKLTIVSSLDPCAMCAGAILRSGMRTAIVAEDNYAGVHFRREPVRIPWQLQAQASRDMAFCGVKDRRSRPIAEIPSFLRSDISSSLVDHSTKVFSDSVTEVQQKVGGGDQGPEVFEPTGETLSGLRKLAERLGPHIRVPSARLNAHDNAAGSEVLRLLDNDGSILVDQQGNVIVGASGAENVSSARTSVLELIRGYTRLRHEIREQLNIVLPPQHFTSIVKRRAPAEAAKGLLELGATGSFLELKRPDNPALPAMAFVDQLNLDRVKLFAASLPQLYLDIGITVGLIARGQ